MGRGKELTKEQIAAISSLILVGKDNKEISAITGLALRSVQRWTKKCKDAGESDPPLRKKRTGKARLTSQRTLKVLQCQVDLEPRISAKELREKNPRLLQAVSVRTIQRRLRDDLCFQYRAPRRKPILTTLQKKKILLFSKKYLAWEPEKWKKVLWSDEATFTVTGNRGGKVRLRAGSDPDHPKYTEGTVKHPDSVMVWGAFGYHGTGELVVLPKNLTVNKERYLELLADHLEDCFIACQSEIFQQDGAPAHTAKLVSSWFEWVGVDYIRDWPGNSPDLSPIENIWALMKRRLRGRDTSTVPKLVAQLQDIWANLDPSLLQNLALSVPKRLQSCRKKKGYPTKY
ncbi:Transposable element Tcb1 transposase [Chionoecetes opilio]|uniref:Transposable element Tcb1 transposase n=1 Tax=Chionoecetes opilio TaxID=41210 RepID=A0A8J4XYD3_CHIOP|nr:Transposable element Tcb1 transposase [Chionoecetes opilio]